MPDLGDTFRLVNWNVAGAKYLEIKSERKREDFKVDLNRVLHDFTHSASPPHIITMQEIVRYHRDGNSDNANRVVEEPEGYKLLENILVDTNRHSHQGKWNKVRRNLGWGKQSYLGQGNGLLVRRDVMDHVFPVMVLPAASMTSREWCRSVVSHQVDLGEQEIDCTPKCESMARNNDLCHLTLRKLIERVALQQGMYFGNRDTEPRLASVCHICWPLDGKPLDIFIVNVHLTTLSLEREGIPWIDSGASKLRLTQLDTIFNGIVSQYQMWRKSGYMLRGEEQTLVGGAETCDRHSPVWFIAGDFNFPPESEEYRRIMGAGFRDMIVDHRRGTKSRWGDAIPTLTVDYVFVGPLFESISKTRLIESLPMNSVLLDENKNSQGEPLSDHYPIRVSLPLSSVVR